jgi:hypothetical protein
MSNYFDYELYVLAFIDLNYNMYFYMLVVARRKD